MTQLLKLNLRLTHTWLSLHTSMLSLVNTLNIHLHHPLQTLFFYEPQIVGLSLSKILPKILLTLQIFYMQLGDDPPEASVKGPRPQAMH